ncbi:MAG: coproporphyrinogen III oxidase family protein [Anaerolineales bacterium]|nr:MAG: coproporphyrinogen III oxidase family protein [Anaerolineales bacterium]
MDAISFYVHVPFCRAKCAYCDFNSYSGLDHLFEKYVRALQREMRWVAQGRSLKVNTIYLGGGTPTVLPLALLGEILDACREHFMIAEGAEITVEANPGTVDGSYLAGLLETGVNRLSLGVQSFHDDELRLLGRIHTAAQAVETYRLARQQCPELVEGPRPDGSTSSPRRLVEGQCPEPVEGVGFGNVSLDLIYGLPQQPFSSWQGTLRQAIHLRPDHLSLYCLTVEEGTPLGQCIARGELPLPDPDLAAEMYILAEETLDRAGYIHYEISNWAQPGHECRHNLVYWRNRSYLGLGAGAHSYLDKKRWHNVLSPAEYIARLEADWQTAPAGFVIRRPTSEYITRLKEDWQGLFPPSVKEVEEIDDTLEMAETMILGLRLVQAGVGLADFRGRFGRELVDVYSGEVREMEQAGLLEVDGERVRLTARGRLLGNEVFQRFLPESTV